MLRYSLILTLRKGEEDSFCGLDKRLLRAILSLVGTNPPQGETMSKVSHKNNSFVVYSCDVEVFVTTRRYEEDFISEYFASYTGRNIDDFDREESDGNCVEVKSKMTIDF